MMCYTHTHTHTQFQHPTEGTLIPSLKFLKNIYLNTYYSHVSEFF